MSARLYEEAVIALRSDTTFYASAALATFPVYKMDAKLRGKVSTTRPVGPPSPSLIHGITKDPMESDDRLNPRRTGERIRRCV